MRIKAKARTDVVGIADTSRASAFRDIEDLVKNGLLLAEGTGRGTRYNLFQCGDIEQRFGTFARCTTRWLFKSQHSASGTFRPVASLN